MAQFYLLHPYNLQRRVYYFRIKLLLIERKYTFSLGDSYLWIMKTILPWMMLARGSKCFYQGNEFARSRLTTTTTKILHEMIFRNGRKLPGGKLFREGQYSGVVKREMGGYHIIKEMMFHLKLWAISFRRIKNLKSYLKIKKAETLMKAGNIYLGWKAFWDTFST